MHEFPEWSCLVLNNMYICMYARLNSEDVDTLKDERGCAQCSYILQKRIADLPYYQIKSGYTL